MGLFLGMSILSVIEVIIYVCKISWLFVSSKRRQHMIAKDEKVIVSGINSINFQILEEKQQNGNCWDH